MRRTLYGGWLLVTGAVVLGGPSAATAQPTALLTSPLSSQRGGGPAGLVARGQYDTTYPVPGLPVPAENVPIPTGNPGQHGFFTIFEFRFLTTNRTIGDQTVAYRGLVDATGVTTGIPGAYLGSGVPALTTDQFGRTSWLPGYTVGLGYKTDEGVSVYGTYTSTVLKRYSAGASGPAPPFFRSRQDLTDTFLVSGVFNFTPAYAGPNIETTQDLLGNAPTANFYGIWNGAEVMTIEYDQRFVNADITARVPLLQTELSRIYGLGGFRFSWFFERFRWRTEDADIDGIIFPQFAANYTNTLSQRMYGPFLGCGHEVYVGKRFSVSLDLTGAALLNIVKERAKYKLGDDSTQNKRSWNDYTLVPNANADLNLWWYPIEGVQVRAGYTAQTYFNTRNMLNPIGFNYGAIDPVYNTQVFRIVHGFNVGLGLFF